MFQFLVGNDGVIRRGPGDQTVLARPQVLFFRHRRAPGGDQHDEGVLQPQPGDAAVADFGDGVPVIALRFVAALVERRLEPLQMVVEAEKAALPHMHRVIAHVGELEPHVGDRDAKRRQRRVFAVHDADAFGAVKEL